MPLSSLLLGAFCVSAALFFQQSTAQPFEQVDRVPSYWSFAGKASPDTSVTLHIAVRQQNLDYFEQLVLDISDPDHEKYGQHLEGHEVKALLRPTEEASNSVIAWLQDSNVTAITDDSDIVTFTTTVENANKMLNTEFAWYEGMQGDKTHSILRTLQYSVPKDIHEHVEFVQPTTKFGSLRPLLSTMHSATRVGEVEDLGSATASSDSTTPTTTAPSDAACFNQTIPACLLKLYNVHYGGSSTNGNKLSYGSFLNQYARYEDLASFTSQFAPYAAGSNFSVVRFNRGENNQSAAIFSIEANGDNQYQISIGWPTPVTEFSTGGYGPEIPDPNNNRTRGDNEPYLQFLLGLSKLSNAELPQTLSISYGDDEQSIPIKHAKRVCNMFMELGARGVSVLFASGDSGPGAICLNNNGTVERFIPVFPAGCPWVTTVGATVEYPTEVAVGFSGGGFSDYFARPAYQKKQVAAYLAKVGNTNSQYYNRSGRGYPDVAAQGVFYQIVSSGSVVSGTGTSASAPTFAGIVALLNSARITAGKPTLGFLNPFLYSKGYAALNDITTGGSLGCGNFGNLTGWNATVGWDAITGLGTPDFGKLLKLTSPSACNVGGPLPNPTLTAKQCKA